MRAAVCRSYGPPDVVAVEEVDAPALTTGQVRVRVGAAAVNFPDVLIVANTYQVSAPPPFVPGSEFAGVVAEVAADGRGVAAGGLVVGTRRGGRGCRRPRDGNCAGRCLRGGGRRRERGGPPAAADSGPDGRRRLRSR